jgi:hypothetical protein
VRQPRVRAGACSPAPGVSLPHEAVAQTPGELAGSVLTPGSENGQLVRQAPPAAGNAARLSRSGPQFCERAAPFPRRLCATASRGRGTKPTATSPDCCFGRRLPHKAVSEKTQLARGSARQRSHARRPRDGRHARDERDGRFRNPPLEAIQRARRGFVRQPRRAAKVADPRSVLSGAGFQASARKVRRRRLLGLNLTPSGDARGRLLSPHVRC